MRAGKLMTSQEGGQYGGGSCVDRLCASFYVLQFVSNTEGFLSWLRDYHHIEATEEILAGYKYLIDSIFKCVLDEISGDFALGLTEDEVFYRARHKGITLLEIPHTCEKVILLKRVWTHGKAASKAQNWEALQGTLKETLDDLDIFKRLIDDHFHTSLPFSKDFIVQSLVCDLVFTFLNDTSQGIPKAELMFPSVESTATEVYLYFSFPGYVYGLQYLWHSILGSEEFERTCVKQLHLVLSERLDKPLSSEGDSRQAFLREVRNSDLDEEEIDFIEGVSGFMPPTSERFGTLDRFWRQIQEEIVNPREDKILAHTRKPGFLVLEGYSKDLLKGLLDPGKVAEPEYMTKSDASSIKRRLHKDLLWYDVNVLDSQKLLVFNGAPAFAATLLGSVDLAKAFKSKEPTKTVIFKHPTGWEHQFDYSFGIFIEAYSSGILAADYSGWLIFFDCATDHSGFGGSLLQIASNAIGLARKRGLISVNEITVQKELFKEYLREHSIASVFDTLIKETSAGTKELGSLSTVLNDLEDFVGRIKGKLLEYVTHKWIMESQRFRKTMVDVVLNDEQIDCASEVGDSLSIYECKLNMHEAEVKETLEQVKRKSKALSSAYKKVDSWLVVYGPIPPDVRAAFEKNGISVQDDFRSVIEAEKCFEGRRRKTLELLDWRFRSVGKFRSQN